MNFKRFLNLYGPGLTIALFGLLAFVSVMKLTSMSYTSWNFSSTGQIGDTIGGITAPVIGMLNAILLWWTLRKQNDQISSQESKSELSSRIQVHREMRKGLMFTLRLHDVTKGQKSKELFTGKSAILAFSRICNSEEEFYHEFYLYSVEWERFIDDIKAILIESFLILKLNYYSSETYNEKRTIYDIVTFQNTGIRQLFDSLNAFIKRNKDIEGAKSYIIDDWEDEVIFFTDAFDSFEQLIPKNENRYLPFLSLINILPPFQAALSEPDGESDSNEITR